MSLNARVAGAFHRGGLALVAAWSAALIASPAAAVSSHSTAIDLTPAEDEVWVVNPDLGTVGVLAISGSSATLVDEIPVGGEPWCVDVHPTNGEAWVTSMRDNKVTIIDVATRTVIDSIQVGFDTFGVSFDPQGINALVTGSGSDEIYLIDVATRTISATLPCYRRPRGIAWRADGQRAWVTHLLMPEFLGRLTTVFPDTHTTSQIIIFQTFGQQNGGYPSTMQNCTVAPAPYDNLLWIPNNMINTTAGIINGYPLTFTNIFHAAIAPVNLTTSTHLSANTYFMTDSGTPVGGPIAVDFYSDRAYVANLHSNNVTVMHNDILNPSEVGVVPAGDAPIGIVTRTNAPLIYVANWLSRNVTIFSNTLAVTATVPSTFGPELLPGTVLNGKKFFYTSNDPMALDDVGACASCHVFGTMDGRPWDLTQFGKGLRATPDARGIAFTGAHDWTSDKDEMQDHEFGILEFTGGAGLTGGTANPPLGAPNAGINADLDALAAYMATLRPRTRTPFQNPDGSLTADALAGEVLFNDVTVGCAGCHVPPLYTDSDANMPFIKHIVGTADSTDTDAAAGFDTPSLCGVWDTGPYLHNHFGQTIEQVLVGLNPNDLHGTTSQLTPTEISQLAEFVRSIAWPDTVGQPTGVPTPLASRAGGELDAAFPNPFLTETSLRFSLDAPASEVRIDVFDVAGRRVATILDRALPRGTHIAGWNSRDGSGRKVAPGTYFARLSVDGRREGDRKMTVLR
jgi:large repetitive protein